MAEDDEEKNTSSRRKSAGKSTTRSKRVKGSDHTKRKSNRRHVNVTVDFKSLSKAMFSKVDAKLPKADFTGGSGKKSSSVSQPAKPEKKKTVRGAKPKTRIGMTGSAEGFAGLIRNAAQRFK